MNVLPMANFQAPEVHWVSLAPILIVLGGAVLGVLVEAFAPVKARRPLVIGLSILATASLGGDEGLDEDAEDRAAEHDEDGREAHPLNLGGLEVSHG